MLTRRDLLAGGLKSAVAFGAAGGAVPAIFGQASPDVLPPETEALKGKHSLKAHAHAHGLMYGSAVRVKDLLTLPAFARLIREQCGIVVPASELKWVALRPSRDRFDFTLADDLLAFAKRNHIKMRGHTLCWHNSVPDWITTAQNRPDTRQLFVDHITTVCRHYAGHLQSWDVVNEAILPKDGQPGGLRKSFWFDQMGPDYIDLAFRTARAADPHALLTYNDYGVEFDDEEDAERRKLVLELLRGMKQRNVPLDAVGIQSHVKAGQPYTFGKGLADYLESIRQMGLQIYLTELDVNEDDLPYDNVERRDKEIAKIYRDYLQVALANPAVKELLTWNISDRFTWLNDGPTHHKKQPNRPQRSLPFDSDFKPKDAFFAIRDTFDDRRV
ncbi:endo-1,4-beta-xylanase [Silvibacterium bohemicum]|uniref:Beta-xylanase n=1 Tax=Silvibacterium bohemicum TaxID=1577686 RepID=A0A841JV37_9BACT|nr:endo-1,4-beta-xylanase [Silvibacterium bohemicum]MBB6143609.1 endo-1,4-beta-xylanase [Silvibacterium bohemicum]